MNNTSDKRIKSYTKTSVYADLKDFCTFSINKEGDFIEVTEWYNGEGFDVVISGTGYEHSIQMTYGQYEALCVLVEQLDKVKQDQIDRTQKLADLATDIKPKARTNSPGLKQYPSPHDCFKFKPFVAHHQTDDNNGF